jgi:ATP-dependent RNA helicase RhlE
VLAPTRELAVQVGESIARYGRHTSIRHTLVFGGVGEYPQIRSIAQGTDVVIATPGRLLDLMSQGHVNLDRVEVFVLDEADRMLDMGFAPDVKRRQSLLFSATMPESIRSLAASLLTRPETVEVAPVGTTAERVEQQVCFVPRAHKQSLLVHWLKRHSGQRVLVFARTKHGADRLARQLVRDGHPADAIHGDKSQGARQRALKNFADGKVPVLVATDIAARGIDVKDIGLVVNFELPEEAESYVHRIGRTARAGASGLAVAFCDAEERGRLRDIQRLIRATIPVDTTHPYAAPEAEARPATAPASHSARPRALAGATNGFPRSSGAPFRSRMFRRR